MKIYSFVKIRTECSHGKHQFPKCTRIKKMNDFLLAVGALLMLSLKLPS